MMNFYFDYSIVKPAPLSQMIRRAVRGAICNWKDINGEYFEFEVYGYNPLTAAEKMAIEEVIAPFV